MKTFFKIVGIGCGILLLVLLVGSLVVYKACGSTIGELWGTGRKAAQHQKQLEKLDRDFPFEAPSGDQAVRLDEGRLTAYLAIRKAAFDSFKSRTGELEALGKEMEAKKARNEQPSMVEVKKIMTLAAGLVNDTRGAYVAGLTEHGMSPTEFRAITTTLYGGSGDSAPVDTAQQESLDRQIAQKKVDLASEQDSQRRTLIDAELKALQAQRNAADGLFGIGDPGVLAANSGLIAARKPDIDALRDPALDGMLSGQGDQGPPPVFNK